MNITEIKINERAKLTTYFLNSSAELRITKRPMVVIFPGGGYVFCSDREAEPVALKFAAAGFHTAILTYTTGKGFKEAYQDAQAAMTYLYSHKEDFSFNSIIVCGFSAGAHLACSVATLMDSKPDGMILGYPPLLKEEWASMCPDVLPLIDQIDERTPKTFLFHAYDDFVVPVHNSYRLMEKLNENHVEFEAHIFATGGHGFSIAEESVSAGDPSYRKDRKSQWVTMAIDWIKERIGNVEFEPRETMNEKEIPDILRSSLDELLKQKNVLTVFEEDNSPLLEEKIRSKIGGVPLYKILIGMGQSLSQIKELAAKINKKR